jgi:hypothetical protein
MHIPNSPNSTENYFARKQEIDSKSGLRLKRLMTALGSWGVVDCRAQVEVEVVLLWNPQRPPALLMLARSN